MRPVRVTRTTIAAAVCPAAVGTPTTPHAEDERGNDREFTLKVKRPRGITLPFCA